MRNLSKAASVLLIIGGLNWGLVGLFNFDLVAAIFGGSDSILSEIVYTLVGLAAVAKILTFNAADHYGRHEMGADEVDPGVSVSTTDRVDRIDRVA